MNGTGGGDLGDGVTGGVCVLDGGGAGRGSEECLVGGTEGNGFFGAFPVGVFAGGFGNGLKLAVGHNEWRTVQFI